jgi:adenylosuccinate lyase
MIRRYQNVEIANLWAPDEIYRRWWGVEWEHAKTIAGDQVAHVIRMVGPPTESQVRYHESKSGHEMIAFLTALDERIKWAATNYKGEGEEEIKSHISEARAALHRGLTSSDVQDTALALGLWRSKVVVDQAWGDIADALLQLMNRTRGTTVGRTHGQLASVMPAAHRWEVLYAVVSRCYARVAESFLNLRVGKLSGPVGTLQTDDECSTLERLGLAQTTSSQLVPRDRLANWAYQISSLITACEAVATQVWLLAQQGIDGVLLGESVSSSAMPHKRNPTMAENVRGLARMARPLAQELQLGMVQWGEHDLAHSSVERVAVPDLLHLAVTSLQRTAALVSGVTVVEPTLPDGYRDTSAVLRSAQAAGMAYVDAHAAISSGTYQDGKIVDTTVVTQEGP